MNLKQILEALLLSSMKPLSLTQMRQAFSEQEMPTKEAMESALVELALDYRDHAIELKRLASGYCFQTKIQYNPWIHRLQEEKPQKYSRALLETLAIIAYRQPVTRADIEEIRGVSVTTNLIRTLLERQWISIIGHRDVPGKPVVYATTTTFLDYFNLSSISELPKLSLIDEPQELIEL